MTSPYWCPPSRLCLFFSGIKFIFSRGTFWCIWHVKAINCSSGGRMYQSRVRNFHQRYCQIWLMIPEMGDTFSFVLLTHWGRVTHICVSKLPTIGSDNGSSPGRRQAIIWTNAGILLIGPLWTHFSEILIEIPTFSFKKMRLKVSSGKRRPFSLGLNVLNDVSGLPKQY